MGAVAAQSGLGPVFASRWQIPALILALSLLGTGLFHERAKPKTSSAADVERVVGRMLAAGDPAAVVPLLEQLLADPKRDARERPTLHRLLGRALYLVESQGMEREPKRVASILKHYKRAEFGSAEFEPVDHLARGEAFAWTGEEAKAAPELLLALAGRIARADGWRRRLAEWAGEGKWTPQEGQVPELIDGILSDSTARPANLAWALERRVGELLEAGRGDEAAELIQRVGRRLAGTPHHDLIAYLTAETRFSAGALEDAERALRDLRGRWQPRDELWSKVTQRLGEICVRLNRPEEALTFFEDVLKSFRRGAAYEACLLGSAEALAALDRFGAAADAMEQVVALVQGAVKPAYLDRGAVRTFLHTCAQRLEGRRLAGSEREAVRFFEFSAMLLDPDEKDRDEAKFLYERIGALHAALALRPAVKHKDDGEEGAQESASTSARALTRMATREASHTSAHGTVQSSAHATPNAASNAKMAHKTAQHESAAEPERPAMLDARGHALAAGEAYLKLSRLELGQEANVARAVWKALDAFELAGASERKLEVLKDFLKLYPAGVYSAGALRRIGLTYQAMRRPDEAAAMLWRVIREHPRTADAIQSVVPLAEVLLSTGEMGRPEAERLLVDLVDQPPGSASLVTPNAPEFREGLALLARHYHESRRPEDAVERLESVLGLYPDDARATQWRFWLAEDYRASAAPAFADVSLKESPSTRPAAQAVPMPAEQMAEYRQRMEAAEQNFARIIDILAPHDEDRLTAVEREQLRSAYLRRADCQFDLGRYEDAASAYAEAQWRYENETIGLTAALQIVQCQLRMGRTAEARRSLERAKWLLKKMPDSAFRREAGQQDRGYWLSLLDRVAQSGLFS